MASVLLCGGGTGGHITPLLAVAKQLKKSSPGLKLIYVGEKSGRFKHLVGREVFDEVKYINAGKFRRYHKQNWALRLIDLKTNALNLRDFFRFMLGLFEARRLLKKLRPDCIFIKGGFVGVPIGFAAARLKIPYITHDSDALPGLANRLIAKKAAVHATGLPEEYYSYPKAKTRFVGVPLREEFRPVGTKLMQKYRRDLKISEHSKVILVTGGSLGAVRMNNFVAQIVPELLNNFEDLIIIHGTGANSSYLYGSLPVELKKRVISKEFLDPMYKYSGAADVIVTRAGATNMAEFALQRKPCVMIPNPQLTGGHQMKNAIIYEKANAAIAVSEATLKSEGAYILLEKISELLKNKELRRRLSKNIAKFAKENSTQALAGLILETIGSRNRG